MANEQIINLGQQIYDADNSTPPKTVVDVVRDGRDIVLVFSDDSRFVVTGMARRKLEDWLGD